MWRICWAAPPLSQLATVRGRGVRSQEICLPGLATMEKLAKTRHKTAVSFGPDHDTEFLNGSGGLKTGEVTAF